MWLSQGQTFDGKTGSAEEEEQCMLFTLTFGRPSTRYPTVPLQSNWWNMEWKNVPQGGRIVHQDGSTTGIDQQCKVHQKGGWLLVVFLRDPYRGQNSWCPNDLDRVRECTLSKFWCDTYWGRGCQHSGRYSCYSEGPSLLFTVVCFLKPRTFYTKAMKRTKIVKKLSKARALQNENWLRKFHLVSLFTHSITNFNFILGTDTKSAFLICWVLNLRYLESDIWNDPEHGEVNCEPNWTQLWFERTVLNILKISSFGCLTLGILNS